MGIKNSPKENNTFNRIIKQMSRDNFFLEQLLEKLPNAIGIFDEQGRYITSNEKFHDLFKITPPKDYSIFEDPHFKDKNLVKKFKNSIKNDLDFKFPRVWYNIKNIYPKYTDNEICVESNAIPLKDENGELKYILIIYEDKTEVEKESMILKNFIELNPYAIEIKDKNGYNIMYNQAFIDLWEGTPPDDYSVLEDPKMKETGQIEFFKRLYNGNIIDVQEFYFNPRESRSDLPDHPAWLRTVCFPIFNRKREVDQVVIMYEDITERKLTQIKLEQLKKQLENRVKERTILLENSEKKYRKAYKRTKCFKGLFTHDVSNIVQVVSNSLELLKERMGASLEKKGKEKGLISAMETNLARAKKMIHNIRNLEEIEESEVPIIPTKLFFHLENAIGFVKANFINKNIQISLQKDLEEIYVLANELLLDVFENILINAIRYNDNDIITIDIKVSEFSEEEKDFIKIEFIDNGIGIKDSRKERIFEENYERGNSSKGMGLGLSLVSKIITLCHGKLWVENRIPDDHSKGSNFIVQIPKALTK